MALRAIYFQAILLRDPVFVIVDCNHHGLNILLRIIQSAKSKYVYNSGTL